MSQAATASTAFAVFLQGLALGLGLIVAIGAQNAFVLRQGLRREHVGAVVLLCAGSDALLIVAGVLGMGKALGQRPALAQALALAGAAFLAAYAVLALRRACRPLALHAGLAAPPPGRLAVLAQAAAFTWLNPHVYLDTLLLVGGLGAQQAPALRPSFVAGACAASIVWFGALGYGARRLAPWFARPRAWQWLDGLVAVTMAALAAAMLRLGLAGG